jgi:DNA invertase Pin-like site-specific DNA recombinase
MSTRAAVYARISDDPEGLELGTTRQVEDCRSRAERDGYDIAVVYSENDRGASTRSKKPRPKYDAMLDAIRAGEIDVVISYSNSRLTRRPMEFEQLIQLHEQTGVRYLTVMSGDDNLATADGRMVARIKAAVDAAEAERISERVARAALQRAEQGAPNGGTRPYGWTAEDRRRLDPVEHAVIMEVADRLLAGEAVRSVVRDLNQRDIAPVRAAAWSPTTLREMMINPRLAGIRVHKGELLGKGDWQAALDEVTHRQLIDLLTNPDRRTSPGNVTRNLLTGLAACGLCDRPVSVKIVSQTGRPKRARYWCQPCGMWRTMKPIDEYVSGYIVGRLETMRDEPDPGIDQVAAASIERLRERIKATRAAFAADDTMSPDDLLKVLRPMNERLRREETALTPSRRPKVLKAATGPGAADVWAALPLDRKRAIIRELFDVRLMRAPRGSSVFDPASVIITRR